MTGPEYARVKEILLALRELPVNERAAHLERACAGDPDLRAAVESLLAQEDTPAALVQSGALAAHLMAPLQAALRDVAPRTAPERIGPYRIVRPLGQGGMGEVYEAEQDEPVRRVVALKLVRRGLDSREFVRRFEAERQILARLEHPGVARLIDGGLTEDGVPWFTMEFVDGVPLDRYCDEHALTIPERLALFREACAAVQFAHRNLIVHRDLKPGNILVSGDGSVKLLDFGIAKVLEPGITGPAAAPLTRTESRLMTPEFAAPEQIRNQPVTTATDVYALGVVLYGLLSGRRPYAATGLSAHEVETAILTEEPLPPSANLRRAVGAPGDAAEAVARARGTDSARLGRRLAGDLDTICLKALRKEPERRYATVEQLDDDLRRHLEGRPVLARRDTLGYRAGKFVGRHRGAVLAAAGVVALLVGVVSAYTIRLREERDRAREARDASEAVTEFLSTMLQSPNPEERGRDVTVAAVLDSASRTIAREFADRPAIAARLEQAVGRAYHGLGEYDTAQVHLERAAHLSDEIAGPEAIETMTARMHLASLYTDQGKYPEAESLTVLNLAGRRRVLGPEHPETLESVNALANLAAYQGRRAEAESLFLWNLAARRRVLGEDHDQTLNTTGLLANLYADQSRFAEAEPLYARQIEIRRRTLGPEHPVTLSNLNNLALLYMQTARHALAEPLFLDVLAVRRRVLGEEHPETAGTKYNLAILYSELARYTEAEALLVEIRDLWARTFGSESPRTLIVKNNLARLYGRAGRYQEAEALYREVIAARRRVLGAEHPSTLGSIVNLAGVLRDAGRYADAERMFREVLATQRRVLGERHANTLNTTYQLGTTYAKRGGCASAEPLLAEAAGGVAETLGRDHVDWARYTTALGECLSRLGRHAEAETTLTAAYESAARNRSPADPQALATAAALASAYEARGDAARARAWREKARPSGG